MRHEYRTAVVAFSLLIISLLFASNVAAGAVSTFDSNSQSWLWVGFQNVGNQPAFSTPTTSGSVVYQATGGNPGGYISEQDPDGNFQYFSAPTLFLGDQSASIGLNLTFDELIINTFNQPAHNPQAPLVAITDGAQTLIYGGGGSVPPISGTTWNSLTVPLVASSWNVGAEGGPAATPVQFSSVMSSLTGMYILLDFWGGSGADGEIVGLDNVNLPASVPEPSTIWVLLSGLGVLGLCRRIERSCLGRQSTQGHTSVVVESTAERSR